MLKIGLSEEDIQDLQNGESFNWNFDGVDVFLYNESTHALICSALDCMELQGEDGEYCPKHDTSKPPF